MCLDDTSYINDGFAFSVSVAMWLDEANTRRVDMSQKRFRYSFGFKAVEVGSDDGPVVIEGYASTYSRDREGERVAPGAFKNLTNYRNNPIVFYDHTKDKDVGRKAIGRVTDMRVDAGGLWVRAEIHPSPVAALQDIYNKVKNGILTTFSIGGMFRTIKGIIQEVDLMEISVVPLPCVPDAVFSLVKSFDMENFDVFENLDTRVADHYGAGAKSVTAAYADILDAKAGRVVSTANSDRIRQALTLLSDILTDAEKTALTDAAEQAETVAAEIEKNLDIQLAAKGQDAAAEPAATIDEATIETMVQAAVEKRLNQRTVSKAKAFGGSAPAVISKTQKKEKGFVDLINAARYGQDFTYKGQLLGGPSVWVDGEKAMSGGTATAGGYIVPEEWYGDLITLRRAKAVVRRSGATTLPMKFDTLHLPREAADVTAQWTAENGTITASDQTFGELILQTKKLTAMAKFSNELLMDSSPAIDAIVKNSLAKQIGLGEDLGFLTGVGSATVPNGLLNIAGKSVVSMGANGAALTNADPFYDLIYAFEAANTQLNAWYIHPRVLNSLRKLKDSTNNYIFSSESGVNKPANIAAAYSGNDIDAPASYTLLGRPVYLTTQLPINQVQGTSGAVCTSVIGVQADRLIIGERMGMEISVTNQAGTSFENDQTWVRAIERVDFNVMEALSVGVITGIL